MTEDGKVLALVLVFGCGFILIALITLLRRGQVNTKRSLRNLEHIELRLDAIEATMKALPRLLLEAYTQLERRREHERQDR